MILLLLMYHYHYNSSCGGPWWSVSMIL
jgi:hypothetical protein